EVLSNMIMQAPNLEAIALWNTSYTGHDLNKLADLKSEKLSLRLSGSAIENSAIEKLVLSGKSFQLLHLDETMVSPGVGEWLGQLDVKSLRLHNTRIAPTDIDDSVLSGVTHLDISYCFGSDAWLNFLGGDSVFPNLVYLDLRGNYVGNQNVSDLVRLFPRLEVLLIRSDLSEVTEKVIPLLSQLRFLEYSDIPFLPSFVDPNGPLVTIPGQYD
ncbi:MAG: hypothetical protein AAF226_14305, partial [Verrucomicrobiota bacterium]